MTKQELINQIAGETVTMTKVELEEKSKLNEVWSEIAEASIEHTEHKTQWKLGYTDIDFNDDYLYRMEMTESGIRYYEGTEERYLEEPVGEESWSECQWGKKEIKMLIEGLSN